MNAGKSKNGYAIPLKCRKFRLQEVIHSYNKSQRDALFLKLILIKNFTCFGHIYCPSSGVSTLYTQQ